MDVQERNDGSNRPNTSADWRSVTAAANDRAFSRQLPAGRRAGLGLWEYIAFSVAYRTTALLLGLLSLSGLYRFGRAFGTLEWLINYKRRQRFASALSRVLGRKATGAERRRATREFFMQNRCDKLFYLIFDRITRDQALSLLTIDNQRLLDRAMAEARGVYVALSHHGPHHVIAMLLALRGYKTAGVRDRSEGAIRRYVQDRFNRRYPEFEKLRVIYADAYPRDIYRCLRDGYMLGSAIDISRVRDPNQRMESVSIFGKDRPFLTGPLRIAIRCRAPVLQAFIIPEAGFRYRFQVTEELLDVDKVVHEGAAVREAIKRFAANLERAFRERPSLLTRI